MSNILLSSPPSLRLSDDDIPPVTATLRWHLQPRPRPPKPRSFSTPARGPRHARQPKSPTPLPIQAGSSVACADTVPQYSIKDGGRRVRALAERRLSSRLALPQV